MQTIKTAVVVVLLLAVCYGAIVALNAPDPKLPPELQQWADGSSDLDLSMDATALVSLDPPRATKSGQTRTQLNSLPANSVRESNLLDSEPVLVPPTLPKFDLSGQPTNSRVPTELASLPTVRPHETQGPDGPVVALPNAPGIGDSLPPNAIGLRPADPAAPGKIPIPGMLTASSSSNSWSNSAAPELPRDPRNSPTGTLASNPSFSDVSSPTVNAPTNPPSFGDPTQPAQSTNNSATAPKLPTLPFKMAREQSLQQAAAGKLKDALAALSPYYHSVELTRDEFVDLVDMLDALSREVIYSKHHLMEPPYRAVAGDTLQSIALKHNVSSQLLARINGLAESNVVLPGTELKVLRGPFRAEVDLTRGELTILVDDLYAGRFPISTGEDPVPREGIFEIVDKRRDRTYYGNGGNIVSAEDPRNPYGGYWINLGQDMCIHGTPEMATTDLSKAGCISLSPIDASDIYGILAQGSRIRVHR